MENNQYASTCHPQTNPITNTRQRGLKYVHSAGVVHRDLKPSNILINENCDLKICDFGLARVQEIQMTGYVSTRYYRAPEIMLTWRRYNEKVDIWSAGCIFAEMILGSPIFPGKNHINQFMVITQMLGSPPEAVINNITSENVSLSPSSNLQGNGQKPPGKNKSEISETNTKFQTLTFLRSLPDKPRQSLSKVLPKADTASKLTPN
jgi:serine/threonine protein kinase